MHELSPCSIWPFQHRDMATKTRGLVRQQSASARLVDTRREPIQLQGKAAQTSVAGARGAVMAWVLTISCNKFSCTDQPCNQKPSR